MVSSGKRQLKPLVEGQQSLFPRVFRIVISTGSPDAMPRLAWPLNLKFIFLDEIMFEKALICKMWPTKSSCTGWFPG